MLSDGYTLRTEWISLGRILVFLLSMLIIQGGNANSCFLTVPNFEYLFPPREDGEERIGKFLNLSEDQRCFRNVSNHILVESIKLPQDR